MQAQDATHAAVDYADLGNLDLRPSFRTRTRGRRLLHLEVTRQDGLPPSAWLLNLSKHHASLLCGRSVMIGPNAFFEVAWAGPLIGGERFGVPSDQLPGFFASKGKSIYELPTVVPPTSGKLLLLYHHNCRVTPDGLEVRPKPVPPSSSPVAPMAQTARSGFLGASNA